MESTCTVQEVGSLDFGGQVRCSGLKVVKSCSYGNFIFICSHTFVGGCIVYPQCTASQTGRQTDRRTDDSIMPIADQQYDRPKSLLLCFSLAHHG